MTALGTLRDLTRSRHFYRPTRQPSSRESKTKFAGTVLLFFLHLENSCGLKPSQSIFAKETNEFGFQFLAQSLLKVLQLARLLLTLCLRCTTRPSNHPPAPAATRPYAAQWKLQTGEVGYEESRQFTGVNPNTPLGEAIRAVLGDEGFRYWDMDFILNAASLSVDFRNYEIHNHIGWLACCRQFVDCLNQRWREPHAAIRIDLNCHDAIGRVGRIVDGG